MNLGTNRKIKEEKVLINNKFDKKCSICEEFVYTGEGFAELEDEIWYTYCASCYNKNLNKETK